MKIKVKNMIQIRETVENLSKIKSFTGFQTYKVAKLFKKYSEEFNILESSRIEIIKKFGTEKDGQISVDPDKVELFRKDLNDYLEKEIDFNHDTLNLPLVEGLSALEMIILEENQIVKFDEK